MEIYGKIILMRKLKNRKNKVNDIASAIENSIQEEKIMKEIRFILIISWIFPFFGTLFLYLIRKKMNERSISVLCKIVNMNFTVVFINFILVSILQTLAFAKAPAFIIYSLMVIITGIFIFGFVSHLIGSVKWMKGEDFSYRFSADFLKPYENIQ